MPGKDVQITNVPNGLINTKTDKNGKEFATVRFKFDKSVGGNGYGALRVPASTVTETSPKFSRVSLDPDKRYGIYYTNADGQRRTDWMYGADVKTAFDKSRTKSKEPTPATPSNDQAAVTEDYGDVDF